METVTTPWGELPVVEIAVGEAGMVLDLRDELAGWMQQRGIDQWLPGDLPIAWLEVCAMHGWVYGVWLDRQLIASVTLVFKDSFIWGDQLEPAGYIHMLMVARAFSGTGLGRALLTWAESRIQSEGCRIARLDCVRSNGDLRRYYEAVGYKVVKVREFHDDRAASGDVPIPAVTLLEKSLGPTS